MDWIQEVEPLRQPEGTRSGWLKLRERATASPPTAVATAVLRSRTRRSTNRSRDKASAVSWRRPRSATHRQQGLEVVVPLCPFIAHYIEQNPEYAELVASSYRER